MAYEDEFVADLVFTLHWLRKRHKLNSDND